MVEMVETAAILNELPRDLWSFLMRLVEEPRPLTDCPSAWAIVEHIHNTNQCRALFATHYHELTTLADQLRRGVLFLAVKDWDGRIIFLHDQSRGCRPILRHPCRPFSRPSGTSDTPRRRYFVLAGER